jgi:hypothetical protein
MISQQDEKTVERTVESRVNNRIDFERIDAVARVWVEAGGDACGIRWLWQEIRDRVAELEKEA